ncbi:MAG: PepSY domain-containing protein [Halioglobus sp.]|nr:PepSY domain-containing protein [Halioglobus sp.]
MSRRTRLVGLLWHWHRRIGVMAAFFVVLLSTTGIVLNHSSDLGLDHRFVAWPWLTQAYGDDSGNLPAYLLGTQWLTRAANGRVYLDANEVAPCGGNLVGAVAAGGLLYAGCAEELLVITQDGELVESVRASLGLPVPLQALGLLDNRVVVRTGDSWRLADLELMEFSERAPHAAIIGQLAPGQLPLAVRNAMPAAQHWLSWERLLLDLHSGRVVGRMGVLWIDAVGVLMTTLATSGIAMWWLHRRRRQRHVNRSGG